MREAAAHVVRVVLIDERVCGAVFCRGVADAGKRDACAAGRRLPSSFPLQLSRFSFPSPSFSDTRPFRGERGVSNQTRRRRVPTRTATRFCSAVVGNADRDAASSDSRVDGSRHAPLASWSPPPPPHRSPTTHWLHRHSEGPHVHRREKRDKQARVRAEHMDIWAMDRRLHAPASRARFDSPSWRITWPTDAPSQLAVKLAPVTTMSEQPRPWRHVPGAKDAATKAVRLLSPHIQARQLALGSCVPTIAANASRRRLPSLQRTIHASKCVRPTWRSATASNSDVANIVRRS